jgi:hypothetical protein
MAVLKNRPGEMYQVQYRIEEQESESRLSRHVCIIMNND